MAYYGVQGIYTKSPTYRHRNGTISKERDSSLEGQLIIGWHDECAYIAFNVDRSVENWGRWHHDKGMSWAPWLAGVPCESCGEPC